MNRERYFIWILLLLMVSCKNNHTKYSIGDASIILDIKNTIDIRFDTISNKQIVYVPLETKEECLIGEVEKIIVKQDKIFVADFTVSKTLFVFDMQGKFLFKINKRGKGPGEYIQFHDFDVNIDGSIYLWDINLCKFIICDSTGTFVREMPMKHRFDFFCMMRNVFYLSQLYERGNMMINLMRFEEKKEKYEKLISERGIYDGMGLVNYSYHKFYYSPHNTYYAPRFSPIIFSINDTAIHPAIGLLNLPVPPEDKITQWNRQQQLMIDDSDYLKDITYIFETDDCISLTLEIGLFFNLIYDKKNKKCYNLAPLYPEIGIPFIMGSTGSHFFGILSPNKELLTKLNQHEILFGLTEESNPAVVFFKLDLN